MKRYTAAIRFIGLVVVALVFVVGKFAGTTNVNSQGNHAPTSQDEKPFDQARALDNLRKSIVGRENKPAEEVFKNIQMFKGIPAARLLRIMEIGYARSLGVNCTHCHVVEQWEKEDKPTKQIAREMAAMVAAINNEHLKKIKNLKSETPVVNCTTCHRGQTKPALNLPESVPK